MVKKVVHICKWNYMCMCITEKVLIDLTIHMAYEKQWENIQLIRKMVRGIRYGVTRLKKEESHHLKDWTSRILSKNIQGLVIM